MARPGNGSRLNGNEPDVKQLLAALLAFKRGDFSTRLPDNWTGVAGKIADTFNDVVATNQRMTQELERIGRVVGKKGRIAQRASLGDVSDSWAEAIGSVNDLIADLVHPRASASSSIQSKRTHGRKIYSNNHNRLRRNCKVVRRSYSRRTRNWRKERGNARKPSAPVSRKINFWRC